MVEVNTLDNISLAERLRNEDAEQFYTLVRMHLSFVLDLNAEECDANSDKKFRTPKWNLLPFAKKPKGQTKPCLEGFGLTADVVLQMQQLISFLGQEENITQEGIFRRSGKLTRQQALKSLITQGAVIDLPNSEYSVHDCASVLKSVLSELPESILTDAHYPAYCQIAEFFQVKTANNEERLLRSLQLLVLLLPSENRSFVREVITLLHLAASHQDKNLMSPDNLATLFTPHLLCPRRLSPEAMHANSQVMSRVVAFMIQQGPALFEIPPTLATDVRAYWNIKEKRKRSPMRQMNESVCDGTAASTVFSFVDRERTAQENIANPTETALAQLYAYIQSLPESSKKRKLIKQFNKENGHGTPLRAASGTKKRTRSRSLGDSIKKHLPVFSKVPKQRPTEKSSPMAITQLASPPCLDLLPPSTALTVPKLKPCLLDKSRQPTLRLEGTASRSKSCDMLDEASSESLDDLPAFPLVRGRASKRGSPSPSDGLAVTPKKSSPSYPPAPPPPCTEHWPETMMTPRSRKPVISLSGTDLCNLASLDSWDHQVEEKQNSEELTESSGSGGTLSSTFRDYLFSRSVLTASPVDLSFSSRTDDFLSVSERNSSELTDDFKSIPESIMNEAGLSDSLLYCLDGNEPRSPAAESDAKIATDFGNGSYAYETAL